MSRISIIIPTINRVDLLEECLAPIVKHSEVFEHLYIIDNGQQDLTKIRQMCEKASFHTEYLLPEENLGCPVSFNTALSWLKGKTDWALILNDDIVLAEEEGILKLHEGIAVYGDKWLLLGKRSFAAALFNMKALDGLEYAPGKLFDEGFFPAYCEDVDLLKRIGMLDGTKVRKRLSFLTPEVFRKKGSTTDMRAYKRLYRKVQKYFIEKWGSKPSGKNHFKIPYDGKKPWPGNDGRPKMHIQVAVQCHFFQKRLAWMLSSMKHQIMPENLHISMSVAYVEGTGNPSTEETIEYFKEQGLDVRGVPYPDESEFQYRGWTRNRQLDECDADWILFADTDMVYPPNFFNVMYNQLLTPEYKDSPHMLHSGRFSTTLNETEEVVNSFEYPCMIDDCWNLTQYLPGKKKSNIGAGFCQIANVKILKESDHPYYCVPGKKIDYSYEKFHKTKSDQHFRKRLGARKIPLPLQYHLQHIRDNEVGKHIELQR